MDVGEEVELGGFGTSTWPVLFPNWTNFSLPRLTTASSVANYAVSMTIMYTLTYPSIFY